MGRLPFRKTSSVNKYFLVRYSAVAEKDRGRIGVLAIAGCAINNDLFRSLADSQHTPELFLGMIGIQLIRARNVAVLVMVLVAGIDEDNASIMGAWIMNKSFRLGAFELLQSLSSQPFGKLF